MRINAISPVSVSPKKQSAPANNVGFGKFQSMFYRREVRSRLDKSDFYGLREDDRNNFLVVDKCPFVYVYKRAEDGKPEALFIKDAIKEPEARALVSSDERLKLNNTSDLRVLSDRICLVYRVQEGKTVEEALKCVEESHHRKSEPEDYAQKRAEEESYR